ncbi:MAG: hypothetical protein U0457_07880 [Candidatus Sericytochromatia bacterium]
MKSVVYKSTNDFLKFLSDRVEQKIENSKNFVSRTKEKTIEIKNNISMNINPNLINPNLKVIE